MEFVNETSFPADVSRTQLFYKDLLMAIVVLKATYRVGPDGAVFPDPNPIPLNEADEETPFGGLEGDYAPIKKDVDLLVLGQAHAPNGQPVPHHPVGIFMGDFSRQLIVFGDRKWQQSGEATPPKPFATMPLTYANAYGGDARQAEEFSMGYPQNPLGKGYVIMPEDVEGVALPNVEDPDERVKTWEDQPTPAGFGAMPRTSSLRGLRGLRIEVEEKKTTVEPAFFNCAHPHMLRPELPLGVDIRLAGMRATGDWEFQLPELYIGLEAHLGSATTHFSMLPDTLCLLPEEQRFFIVFRRTFVYPFVSEQKRAIHVMKIDQHEAAERTANLPRALEDAAADPEDPIALISPDEEPSLIPISHEYMMQYYPLNEIILQLPVCTGG